MPEDDTTGTEGSRPAPEPTDSDAAPGANGADGARTAVAEATHRRVFSWIYGLVVCSAVLAGAAGLDDGWQVVGYVFVSLLVYWAAESYAHLLAARTALERRLHRAETIATLRQGWQLVSASYLPLVVIVAATLAGLDVVTTATLGLVASTLLLLAAGWRAGRVGGLRGLALVGSVAASGLLGLVMIALKYMLH